MISKLRRVAQKNNNDNDKIMIIIIIEQQSEVAEQLKQAICLV